MAMESFNLRTGLSVPMVIYQGSAPALTDIVGGQVKRLLQVDQPLGLPRMLRESGEGVVDHGWRSATMRSGSAEVRFWVAVTG